MLAGDGAAPPVGVEDARAECTLPLSLDTWGENNCALVDVERLEGLLAQVVGDELLVGVHLREQPKRPPRVLFGLPAHDVRVPSLGVSPG